MWAINLSSSSAFVNDEYTKERVELHDGQTKATMGSLTFKQSFNSDFKTDVIKFLSNSVCLCLCDSSSDDEYSRRSGFVVRFVNISFPVLFPLYFFEIRIFVHANLVLRYTRFVVPLAISASPKPNS